MRNNLTPSSKHRELVLHAVLLKRTLNKHTSKEHDLELYSKATDDELTEYIRHLSEPNGSSEGLHHSKEVSKTEYRQCLKYDLCQRHRDEYYTPSATAGDYSPSNPWDAPGMSISDFI